MIILFKKYYYSTQRTQLIVLVYLDSRKAKVLEIKHFNAYL